MEEEYEEPWYVGDSPLQQARKARGLTLKEVERRSHGRVSSAYLSQLERGKKSSPTKSICSVLADIYGLSFDKMREIMVDSGLSVVSSPTRYANDLDAEVALHGQAGGSGVESIDTRLKALEEMLRSMVQETSRILDAPLGQRVTRTTQQALHALTDSELDALFDEACTCNSFIYGQDVPSDIPREVKLFIVELYESTYSLRFFGRR